MQATALITDQHQRFSLQPVTLPEPGPDQIAVRTLYSGVSIGTEFLLVRGKISWGPYPLCTGYQATGVVEQVGEQVEGFCVGDLVYFHRNEEMMLEDGAPVSCALGAHCSHAVVRPHSSHGAALLPVGAPPQVACLFVMPSVGLAGVDMVNPRVGQTVVVYGAGLIGLGVIGALAPRGCVVVAVDVKDRQLDLARELGADHVINASRESVEEAVARLAPAGADVVFECTGLPQCLNPAIALCRKFGSFAWQGNYGQDPISFLFDPPHGRHLTMYFPHDDGGPPCRRAVLKGMARGTLPWQRTLTHPLEHTEAPELYERINRGEAPEVVGVTFHWSDLQ